MEEYKQQFQQLVYHIRLYEPTISNTFLVTRFVMGLKEELCLAVEMQLPATVQLAAMYATVQEGLVHQQKSLKSTYQKNSVPRNDNRHNFVPIELWKAKQLKDYRRANGLCYGCGEKYVPGHACKPPTAPAAQLKAAELVDPHELISDAVLDALVDNYQEECATISDTVLSGASHLKTIQLRALIGNQVVLILIDSGSTHTFVDQALLDRVSVPAQKMQKPMQVKVANEGLVDCTKFVPKLTWWIQGHSFSSAMQRI